MMLKTIQVMVALGALVLMNACGGSGGDGVLGSTNESVIKNSSAATSGAAVLTSN